MVAIFYKLPGESRRSVEEEDFWTAKKLTAGIDSDDLDPESFAASCYEANSIGELLNELGSPPNDLDLELWALTADQWKQQMLLGLAALVKEVEEHSEGELK